MATEIHTCPHCKSAPKVGGFKRRYQWKTARGFAEHACYRDEHARALVAAQARAQEAEEAERLAQERLANAPARVIGVGYYVSQPTHEWRGNRQVRVRYEEGRRYVARDAAVIRAETWGYLVEGGLVIHFRDIFPTLEEAQESAEEQQRAYDAQCALAASYR
jgi:hypothetical protein